MWKCFRSNFLLGTLALGFFSCFQKQEQKYRYFSPGYYYRLISYQPKTNTTQKAPLIHLALSFSTQKDSVFWDSYNNFNDLYVISSEESDSSKILNFHSVKSTVNDSFELLIPTRVFFQTQFNNSQIPEFSSKDSVVKVLVKNRQFLSTEEYRNRVNELQKKELELIRNYFTSDKDFKEAKDSLGFYWIQRPTPWSPANNFKSFDRLMLDYEGRFLSERVFEKSRTDFELIYGIPDQMLKGLNYVMYYLNEGQTAKIILPSPLAFGEKGSSNGTVPPYTPVLYNIKLTSVKRK